MRSNAKYKIVITVVFVLMMLAIGVDYFVSRTINYIAVIFFFVSMLITCIGYIVFERYRKEEVANIENNINSSAVKALREGMLGVLVYNEDYEISWMSQLFYDRGIDRLGEKILIWLPELKGVINGSNDIVKVIIDDKKYQVSKRDDAYVLLFKDISKEYDLEQKINNEAYVLGFVNFDNYDEVDMSEEDTSFVNANIKVPVIDYLKQHGIVYKTLRNNRLQLVLNQEKYRKLLDDRFSILNKVRSEAKKGDVDITLSMSFALGSDDLNELDETASQLLEVAQTRGGDQVVVREVGKDAVFYGGSSEAKERQSRVKVRVTANTFKRLLLDSSKVLVVCHKDADADCIGSALVVSRIAQSLKKDAYIVLKNMGIEPMINYVINKYDDVLKKNHKFLDLDEALDILDEDTLVVMVDHHSKFQSSGETLLDETRHIVIIDHHRRSADLDVETSLIYVEAAASSTTEMLVEFLPYVAKNLELSDEEANIMYIGILIDTNHFRTRTGPRTFDVAKSLKQQGADSLLCEKFIEEPFDMIMRRNRIINNTIRFKENILVSFMTDGIYPRSIASQACDQMVNIREIDAAFVVCKTSENETIISARSNGRLNVQAILEKMNGGGHMTAAGLQRKNISVETLSGELRDVLDAYLKESKVQENESNTTE